MVRYLCHNCNDRLLKTITTVVEHVWAEHKIEVARRWQSVLRSEDARLPPSETRRQKVSGFRCEDYDASLSNVSSFLAHLDQVHAIHIWYERGLTKKRVFFDGILNEASRVEKARSSTSKENIPLSKRPHEPRPRKIRP